MKLISYLVIICFTVVTLLSQGARRNELVEITFAITVLYSCYNVFRWRDQPYSLNKMFNIFNLFFLGIAPWLQYKENITFWGMHRMSDNAYLILNLIIIFLSILYNYCYSYFASRTKKLDRVVTERLKFRISNMKFWAMTSISCCVFLLIFYNNDFNPYLMFFRGFEGVEKSREVSSFVGLILQYFIRPIPIIIFLFYMCSSNRKIIYQIILLALAVLTVAPMSVARLMAAAMYIPIGLLLFPYFGKRYNFVVSLVGGLLVVFPFLDTFRHFSENASIKLGLDFSSFFQGHYDAYHNFLVVVSNNFISFGRQLFGALLFFVPRSIWPTKPIGSGAQLAESANLHFDNISMTYMAEGYSNFGIIGSIIFIILLAYISAKLDFNYWHNKNCSVRFRVQYLILVGMFFFIQRGDLMSSFAYTMGMMAAVYVIGLIIYKHKPKGTLQLLSKCPNFCK